MFNTDESLYNKVLAESVPMMTVDAPLSSAIFDINPGHIITTNYDQLLESSRNVFREQYQVIVNDKDLLNADKSKYIIKMHGDLSANNIVLKEQDYLNYSQNHVLMELFIKSLRRRACGRRSLSSTSRCSTYGLLGRSRSCTACCS